MLTIVSFWFQVFQVNQASQVIQGANGQPIVVHSVPAAGQTIQIQNGQALQQLQVVPVPTLPVSKSYHSVCY